MTANTSAPFVRQQFDREQFGPLADMLARNAAARLPRPSPLMPGDLAWRLPGSDSKDNLALFHDEVGLAGFAWYEPDTGFEFDLRTGLAECEPLLRAILDWAEERRTSLPEGYPRFIDLKSMDDWADEISRPHQQDEHTGRYLTTVAFESQTRTVAFLEGAGFESTDHFAPYYRFDLQTAIDAPPPSSTLHLRSVTAADLAARVAVHRAAWLGSSWDLARYEQIRRMPAYEETLDIVLDTGGGFAGYCICWEDAISRVGNFEPVGTHPDWRGRGVGRSVIIEGLHRLQQRGMRYAQVSTAGFNQPAQVLYESCGFERLDTARTFMKVID